jgi:hypothetical protein
MENDRWKVVAAGRRCCTFASCVGATRAILHWLPKPNGGVATSKQIKVNQDKSNQKAILGQRVGPAKGAGKDTKKHQKTSKDTIERFFWAMEEIEQPSNQGTKAEAELYETKRSVGLGVKKLFTWTANVQPSRLCCHLKSMRSFKIQVSRGRRMPPHPEPNLGLALLPRWGRRNSAGVAGLKNESNEVFRRATRTLSMRLGDSFAAAGAWMAWFDAIPAINHWAIIGRPGGTLQVRGAHGLSQVPDFKALKPCIHGFCRKPLILPVLASLCRFLPVFANKKKML